MIHDCKELKGMVKMTSIEVIPNDTLAHENDLEEFSLLTMPSDASPEPGTASYDVRNLQSTLVIASPDLSIEEVQLHLLDMLRENEELKVALKKNNTMMHEQLNTISSWDHQMSQAKLKQEGKLEEANRKISEYQKENEELTSKLTGLSLQIEDASKSCPKCETLLSETTDLQSAKEALIEEKKELDMKLDLQREIQEKLENNISSMSLQLEQLENDKKSLLRAKEELTSFNYALQTQLSINYPDSMSAEDFGYTIISHPDKDKDNKSPKDPKLQLHEKVTVLTNQLKEKHNEVTSSSNKIAELEQELAQSVAMISSVQTKLDEECNKKSDLEEEQRLQQSFNDAKEEWENLKLSYLSAISELESNVKSKNEMIESVKTSLAEAQKQIELSAEKYKKLERLYAEVQLSGSSKVEQLTFELDTASSKLVQLEQAIRNKDHKIRSLSTELAARESGSESVPIFQAQVEVYRTDFECEKRAKEDAQLMVEALEQKIILLEDQMSELQLVANRRHRDKGNSGAEASEIFTCPLCTLSFADVKSIEKHANLCADSLSSQI